jgi:uncharacterized protein
MKNVMEFRATAGELRSDGPMRISGYAAVFDAEYNSGYFVETIRQGAFAPVLKDDVRCLFNHDPNKVLGRTRNNTLSIEEDSKGLRFACDLPDCPTGNEVFAMVRRGDVSGCSFSFTPDKVEWSESGGRREIVTLKGLFDVGPVTYPAYESTSVAARADKSLAEFRSIAFCRKSGNLYGPRPTPAPPNFELERARLRLTLMRYK